VIRCLLNTVDAISWFTHIGLNISPMIQSPSRIVISFEDEIRSRNGSCDGIGNMKMRDFNRTAFVLLCITTIAFSACGQIAAPRLQPDYAQAVAQPLSKPIGLAINGFNYTDLYIASFEVSYQGGGNLYVSSPTSGGGGTVCCVTWRPGVTLPKPIKVRWSRDRKRWCERTVMLNGPVPSNPTAIGVHFMPDGDIQLELSEGYPEVKLKLNNFDDGHRKETGNVIHDEETASCKDGR
jgi:Protein of unknown function (DUF3304)